MKYLLTLLLLVSASAYGSGIYHDQTRSGEGITVVTKGDVTAFALYTYFDASFAIKPVPSPSRKPYIPCHNCPIWYLGVDGIMYMSQAIDYPLTLDNALNVEFEIGTYTLTPLDEGYSLKIICDDLLPPDMFMCSETFIFDKRIIGD